MAAAAGGCCLSMCCCWYVLICFGVLDGDLYKANTFSICGQTCLLLCVCVDDWWLTDGCCAGVADAL